MSAIEDEDSPEHRKQHEIIKEIFKLLTNNTLYGVLHRTGSHQLELVTPEREEFTVYVFRKRKQ